MTLKDGCNRPCFNRITSGSTSAVGLEILRLTRIYARLGIAVSHESFLSVLAGRCETFSFTILIQDRLPDDGPDGIAGRDRILEAFDHDGGYALAPSVAVGTFIKGEAFTIR